MTKKQEWIVKWESGKSQRFIPGDSFGMIRFIINGLEEGKVYVNDDEIISSVLKDGVLYYRTKLQLEAK